MTSAASLITALKTPFTKLGEIDFIAFERLLFRQIASGISGFVVAGTTGDGCFLTGEEQLELLRITRACAGEKAMVLGATSSLETKEMIKRTTNGFEAGMSASLLLPPYYIRPGMQAIIDYFVAALDIGPGIIYNVPHRTGVDVGVEEISQLSRHKNFLGVKECTGLERSQEHHQRGIRVWSGNDVTAEKEVRSGAAFGVISVISNLAPKTANKLFFEEKKVPPSPLESHSLSRPEKCTNISACTESLVPQKKDELLLHRKRVLQMNECLQTLITHFNEVPNPVGISTAMAMVELTEPVLWRPYKIVDARAQEKMLPLLNALATEELDFKTPRVVDEERWTLV
ncbi:MAG: dihydrodipicolinate synthase family protein [Chthoniobacterales bacterium]